MAGPSRARVLVVDDDCDVRSALADILALEGYSVETAVHGQDALAKLQAGSRPDVMLVDLMMPVMNGFELLGELRAGNARRPPAVVVVSANRGYEAEDLGVTAIVRKPFEIDKLLDCIEKAVGKAA